MTAKTMDSYSNFSFFYDELTENADYELRTNQILKILNSHNHLPGLTLDLACGTGSLMFELKKHGIDVFGSDISVNMLTVAKDKAYDLGYDDMLFLNQDMQELELYAPVDTVVCILDSINHLSSKNQIQKTFTSVYENLNDKGAFLFDLNTLYKHEFVLANNSYIYDMENVFCAWQNTFNAEDNSVDIALTFFEKSSEDNKYVRYEENFRETAYDNDEVIDMLKKAGFKNISLCDEWGLEKPNETSQRVYFYAEK